MRYEIPGVDEFLLALLEFGASAVGLLLLSVRVLE